jgi:hypothetical protein
MRSEPFSQRFDRRDVNTSSLSQPVEFIRFTLAQEFDLTNETAILQRFEFTLNQPNTAGAVLI